MRILIRTSMGIQVHPIVLTLENPPCKYGFRTNRRRVAPDETSEKTLSGAEEPTPLEQGGTRPPGRRGDGRLLQRIRAGIRPLHHDRGQSRGPVRDTGSRNGGGGGKDPPHGSRRNHRSLPAGS